MHFRGMPTEGFAFAFVVFSRTRTQNLALFASFLLNLFIYSCVIGQGDIYLTKAEEEVYSQVPFYIGSVQDDERNVTQMVGVIPDRILPYLLGSLNISYEFVFSDELAYGNPKVNGTWPGDLGLLQKRIADVCVGGQYIDYYRFLEFCPLESYQRVIITYLASCGKRGIFDFFTFLYQVESIIWYLFLLSLLLVVAASSFSDTMKDGKWNSRLLLRTAWKSLWIFVASVFCEGSPRTMSSRIGQVLQFIWLFAVLVLVNILYSQFKGILLVKSEEGCLLSVEDIANSPHILPLLLKGSIHEHVLKDSTQETYRRVYDRALTELETCFVDLDQHIDIETYQKVKDGTHVLSTTTLYCKIILKDICHTLTGNRKLYFIPEEVSYTDITFLTNWDFPEYLRSILNQRILWLREGGFVQMWFSAHYRNYDKCEKMQTDDEEELFLQLKHLHTAFFFYFYLILLSLAVLIIELLFNYFLRKAVDR